MSSSITPLTFTGISQFSNDFQTILNRAVSIAQLPVKSLQNQQTDLQQKKVLATALQGGVANLASSLTALGKLGQNKSLTATSSDTSKVSIDSTTATSPASYTITEISSVAQAASETSLTGYATGNSTAASSTGKVKLMVGSQSYTFTLGTRTTDAGSNTLTGLRDAINNLGAGVTATVLTTGTGDKPYYLSITANQTGATTLRVVDDPTGTPKDLLTSAHQGANAKFKLNGVSVEQASNRVNSVIPGVAFTIQGTTTDTTSTVTLSLASDRSKLSSALGNLVTQYNAVAGQVNAQIGPQAGLLSGDSLIRSVQNTMRQLAQYRGSGSIHSLADLGIEFSTTGQMSLNSDKFNALSDSDLSAAYSFLGSATSGMGALANSFTQISDPITGLIKLQDDQYDRSNQRLTAQISTLTDQVNSMQASLAAKLQAADSLVAELQSQQSILNSSITALNYSSYGVQIASGQNQSTGG